MRVLYVAPRYHTNQIPIMQGWITQGHQIMFVSQYAGTPEDYTVLQPVVAGYSKLFEICMQVYCKLFCTKAKTKTREFAFRAKCGFPPLGLAKRLIKTFNPDLVILRERAVYNIPFYQACRKRNISCILYNQSPLWDVPERDRGFLKRIFLNFLPPKRMTPVFGCKEAGKVMMPNTAYIPFVVEPHFSPEEKMHFLHDQIQLICVGRYEHRKNLFLLIRVLKKLVPQYPLHLTIIGEMTDQGQKEYYQDIQEFVEKERLTDRITFYKNYRMEEMYEEYRKADLFVLPSTRERASVSQLEAMSCSLPVICSDTNGSACYVESGINGFLFKDNNGNDLKEKLEIMLSDRSRILDMGRKSYELVCSKYQFHNYYKILMECVPELSQK